METLNIDPQLSVDWLGIGYNNFYFPYQDAFRQDRIIAYSHKTHNFIEIYNNPYPLKYNEDTGKRMTFTSEEYKLIVRTKESLGWDTTIQLDYVTHNNSVTYGLTQRDYSFFDKEVRMDRVEKQLREVASNLSFEEICKMFREICYDQVAYYSEDKKGHIYNDNEYTQTHIEQATYLQRKVSTAVDLYCQTLVNKNTFNEDYLRERLGL